MVPLAPTRCAIREEIARLTSGCSPLTHPGNAAARLVCDSARMKGVTGMVGGKRGGEERGASFCCSSTSQNRRCLMRSMELADGNDRQSARPTRRRRAPVIWPWLLVGAAWTLTGLAVLTNQNSLINHHYLLEESHLPVLVALVVFLVGWQVMTVGMMLPSSKI